jgi:hypothetical protein
MGFEAAPPNEFRATLRPGGRAQPVVAKSRRRATDPKAAGLGDIKVTRSESRSANQRNGDRHRLTDEQAIVRRKGKRHVVDLINVSHGGAMVSGTLNAKLWDRVHLVLGDGGKDGEIECAVRWIRGDRIGLEFAHETRIECDSETLGELLRQVIHNSFPGLEIKAPPAAEELPAEKRLLARHPLIWNGILHHDYEWEVVRLRNISSGGALIECPVSLPVGVEVYLELEKIGRLAATVSWSRGDQTGLVFKEAFDVLTLSQAAPEVAAEEVSRPGFDGEGNSEQSPWAPQWERVSVRELGSKLGR